MTKWADRWCFFPTHFIPSFECNMLNYNTEEPRWYGTFDGVNTHDEILRRLMFRSDWEVLNLELLIIRMNHLMKYEISV